MKWDEMGWDGMRWYEDGMTWDEEEEKSLTSGQNLPINDNYPAVVLATGSPALPSL